MAWAPGRHGLDPVYRRNRLIRESIGKRMIVSVFRIFLLVALSIQLSCGRLEIAKSTRSLRQSSAREPAQQGSSVPRHVMVYHQPGRFGGWPANHGIWSWGDEILVGFSAGYHKDHGPERHAIDHDKPEEHLLARSRDGGLTGPSRTRPQDGVARPGGQGLARHHTAGAQGEALAGLPRRDRLHASRFRHDRAHDRRRAGPSRFYYSTDRGMTGRGRFACRCSARPESPPAPITSSTASRIACCS